MNKLQEKNKQELENAILSSNNYGDYKVLRYINTNNIEVEFLQTKTKLTVTLNSIRRGTLRDPYYPSVYGVGYFGVGKYSSRPESNGPQSTCYKRWKEMIGRCYNKTSSGYESYGARGVTVCKEWLNFQNFAQWWEENCYNEQYQLDKDVLNKNSKQYSPENCCFIPREINTMLTSRRSERGDYPMGVRLKDGHIIAQINYMGTKKHLGTFNTVEEAFAAYKKAKETCIKEYADKYKDSLPSKVYNALYNYVVEITD